MAKPNYSFEKRQRELAKKKKKEEKAKERADRKAGLVPVQPDEGEPAEAGGQVGAGGPAGEQPAP